MAWEENSCISLNMQLIAILSRIGVFMASILKGKSIREAHELAVKVSAYVCTQHGAMPVLPEEYTR